MNDVANATIDTVAQTNPGGDIWGMVVYCLVVLGILYLFMVRPNKKRMAGFYEKNSSIGKFQHGFCVYGGGDAKDRGDD